MKKQILFITLIATALCFTCSIGFAQSPVTPIVKKIIIQPEIAINIIGFEVVSTTDNPVSKTVVSNINLIAVDSQRYDRSGIIVWQGNAYDSIGQWTDSDLRAKISEILNNN